MGKRPTHKSEQEQVAAAETAAQSTDLAETLPMAFESPDSAIVKGAHYDPRTHQLTVDINGQDYTYEAVSLEDWEEFLHAESKGRFFSARIRPLYVGRKR